jgi:hypothetical protein
VTEDPVIEDDGLEARRGFVADFSGVRIAGEDDVSTRSSSRKTA